MEICLQNSCIIVFQCLKPFEQGIEKYVKFFKNIDDKKFVDNFLRVEKWLGDTPPIPGELFKQWIKDIYQENLLIQNKMYVGDQLIDLKENRYAHVYTSCSRRSFSIT